MKAVNSHIQEKCIAWHEKVNWEFVLAGIFWGLVIVNMYFKSDGVSYLTGIVFGLWGGYMLWGKK